MVSDAHSICYKSLKILAFNIYFKTKSDDELYNGYCSKYLSEIRIHN